ncbi:Uncharacterised protein [Mycobacterium tuberculosis]|nr:Uncharacterised protein [Mycobacterium tuberculosis]
MREISGTPSCTRHLCHASNRCVVVAFSTGELVTHSSSMNLFIVSESSR